jgi:hypothetical protein
MQYFSRARAVRPVFCDHVQSSPTETLGIKAKQQLCRKKRLIYHSVFIGFVGKRASATINDAGKFYTFFSKMDKKYPDA